MSVLWARQRLIARLFRHDRFVFRYLVGSACYSVIWERERSNAREFRGSLYTRLIHARDGATRLFHYLRQESYLIIRLWRSASVLFLSFEHVLQLQAHTKKCWLYICDINTLNCNIDYQSHAWAHESIFTAAEMNRGSGLIKECNYIHYMLRQRFFTRRHKSPRFNPHVFFLRHHHRRSRRGILVRSYQPACSERTRQIFTYVEKFWQDTASNIYCTLFKIATDTAGLFHFWKLQTV